MKENRDTQHVTGRTCKHYDLKIMPKNLPDHWPGQLRKRRWGCPMALAGQCGWWLVAAHPPPPAIPSEKTRRKSGPGAQAGNQGWRFPATGPAGAPVWPWYQPANQ